MLKIYNTLSKKEEEFKTLKPNEVSFYQCGPTVYWTQHIGNLRSVVLSDIMIRSLDYLGYKVNFVRNYTDVGHLSGDNEGDADTGTDRMEKASKREGSSPEEIAKKYIDIYEKDVTLLNTIKPKVSPKATEHIKEDIEMIESLLNKDFAYITDLAIYFDTSKVKNYTELSSQNLEKNKKGAGSGEIIDEQKKNPQDFALWFFKNGSHQNALQTWDSPWGEGFPGWHIECSAMSKKYLGDTLDIHMGGIEHIPTHHTNEIAQSESANGVKFVNYWVHNEHLLVDNKKMSKSEGTSYSLSEIIEKGYSPMDLRFFFLQANYRSKQNFTWQALDSAQKGLLNIRKKIKNLGQQEGKVSKEFKYDFTEALEDNFNTPKALAVMQSVLKSDISNEDKLATIMNFDRVLGLKL